MGVREIRIHTEHEHRVLYTARFSDGVYVLHAFEKRTRRTPKHEVVLARARLATLITSQRKKDATERWIAGPAQGDSVERQRIRDLGFSAQEAEHLLVRADLMIRLQRVLASRQLAQKESAKILGVTQPRVSELLNGRIELFSSDTLIDMLARLGVAVRVVFEPSRRSAKAACFASNASEMY